MANFNINIVETTPTPLYTGKTYSRGVEDCFILKNRREVIFSSNNSSVVSLMENYNNAPVQEIVITDITSDDPNYFLEHEGVQITSVMLPYVITTGTTTPNDIGLEIVENFIISQATTTLSIEFYVKDTLLQNGPVVTSTYDVNRVTCSIPVYTVRSTSKSVENCIIQNNSYNVKFSSPTSLGTFIPGIAGDYNGPPHDKLIITNISTSSGYQGTFYYKHNATILDNSQLPYVIDISGIAEGDDIPGLTIEENYYAPQDKSSIILHMYYKIEDNTGAQGLTQVGYHYVNSLECSTEPVCDPFMTNANRISDSRVTFKVNIPSGGNTTVKYEVESINAGNHGYTARVIDVDTLDVLGTISGNVDGDKTTGTFEVTGSSRNIEFNIVAKPTLDPPNPNIVESKFTLFECDGITLIPTSSVQVEASDDEFPF